MLLTRTRILTAILLLVSAGAFATGAALERGAAHGENTSATSGTSGTSHPEPRSAQPGSTEPDAAESTPGDADGGREGATTSAEPTSAEAPGSEASETHAGTAHAVEGGSENLLGVDPESTSLVVAAVLLSALLAVLVLTVGSPLVAVGTAVAMTAFTALDVREVTHQLTESRSGLATLAAVVALLHLLAAIAALSFIRAGGSTGEVEAQA